MQILVFLVTNMLVFPMQISVGCLSERKDPAQMFLRHSGI